MTNWYDLAEIRPTNFESLVPLAREARKFNLSFEDTKNTQWWGCYIRDELVGCCGVIWLNASHTTCRLKSWLILPEWRGCDLGRKMNETRIAWALDKGATRIEVISNYPEIFKKLGFKHIEGKSEHNLYKEFTSSQ